MSRNGPFGLAMGMSIEELGDDLEEVAAGKFVTKSVPKPHSAFESYVLVATTRHGLSWVKAIGHTIDCSPYGFELTSAFDLMQAKLAATYGKSRKTDFLYEDSIWNEPRDWMQSMLSKERILMAVWDSKAKSNLREDIVSIGLIVSALGSDSGYIAVEYSFLNSDAADAEIAALEDDAL